MALCGFAGAFAQEADEFTVHLVSVRPSEAVRTVLYDDQSGSLDQTRRCGVRMR